MPGPFRSLMQGQRVDASRLRRPADSVTGPQFSRCWVAKPASGRRCAAPIAGIGTHLLAATPSKPFAGRRIFAVPARLQRTPLAAAAVLLTATSSEWCCARMSRWGQDNRSPAPRLDRGTLTHFDAVAGQGVAAFDAPARNAPPAPQRAVQPCKDRWTMCASRLDNCAAFRRRSMIASRSDLVAIFVACPIASHDARPASINDEGRTTRPKPG
jgi:hypothetical protein